MPEIDQKITKKITKDWRKLTLNCGKIVEIIDQKLVKNDFIKGKK